jgi:hypothetical protein
MKLIDLLVQELPKRGGWPDGAEIAVQDADSQICFSSHSDVYADKGQTSWFGGDWGGGNWSNPFIDTIADDRHECIVSRKQYESALAESQKPAWDGDGLPPVGCECECHVDEGIIHCIVVGYDFDGKAVVMRNVPAHKYFSIQANSGRIKPLRTEAERKRDAAIEAMQREADEGNNWIYSEYEIIYDAIAEGKIPGVKLDD